ncbi:MAG: M16 family metallopeptidase [Thiohalorhabdus sp.]|uniref:M16 family metallopeptidase n=1 Tax=Thiohalorhabdus sp. TaxID=3094134 RepID=UPI0039810E62
MTREDHHEEWPNGVRLAVRPKPGFAGAALGLWLVNGVRYQAPGEDGHAHLLEHFLLEGPEPGQGRLRAYERLGGRVNAQTGRELTALHGTVPAARAPELARLLAEALAPRPLGREALDRARTTVDREREAWAANPATRLEERALGAALGDDPLARPLLGEADALARATPASFARYWSTVARGGRILVAAVGNVDPGELSEALAPLRHLPAGNPPAVAPPRWHGPVRTAPSRADGFGQLLWLLPAPGAASPWRPTARLANHILGDGMDSRLDRKLRHEAQLAYRFRAHQETYSDQGLWWLEVDTDPEWRDACRRVVEEAVRELAEEGPTDAEVEDAVAHWRAVAALQRDDLLVEMESLALAGLYGAGNPAHADLHAVTPQGLRELMADSWGRRVAPPAKLPASARHSFH